MKNLPENLLVSNKHAADISGQDVAQALAYCEAYKQFLNTAKTEREAVKAAAKMLEGAGYTVFNPSASYKAGDKVYTINRNKAIMAATIGSNGLQNGARISVAHLDSPRLDLKPNPLYENEELAYFKTHYYGGIRKYQWVAIPLAMHGTVVLKNGEAIDICYGEAENEPCFTITDLLPHLSAVQDKRTLPEGIKGEELNILVGSIPYENKDEKNRIKLETMRIINEKYGFTEADFMRAEIEFVPAFKATDVGFDRSLIGAYGQDDRVCAYTALTAEIATKNPANTTICVLCDKEEIGSDGVSGLAGDFVFHFIADLADVCGENYRRVCEKSCCLSADVNAGFDPSFPQPFEKANTAFLNHGLVLSKYTGARGKSGTSDARAEFMSLITNMLDEAGVVWQVGELGKVDAGGGGTVAKFVANRNIEVVDIGVPVLSMHAPFEVTAKLDIYNLYQAFIAFNQI